MEAREGGGVEVAGGRAQAMVLSMCRVEVHECIEAGRACTSSR
jgi:hypothetical protein